MIKIIQLTKKIIFFTKYLTFRDIYNSLKIGNYQTNCGMECLVSIIEDNVRLNTV